MAAEMLLNSYDPRSPEYMPYRLFLMHVMAVDDMGHLHGVTPEYNPYNTYQKAITNTTRVLSRLLDLLDNDTTLVITSDHGHIDRGGHGGTFLFSLLLHFPLSFLV
jgi:predicted AlkP superfamily pyrophosphatase or phosphodiesterase